MGLARDIVELFRGLAADGKSFFGPGAAAVARTGEFSTLASQMPPSPSAALQVCLQALAVHEEHLTPRLVSTEFVATLPATAVTAARNTATVIAEMLAGARREIVAIGYEIDERSFIELLASAGRRVPVTIVWDRERAAASDPLRAWPADVPLPRIFQDREREDAAVYAKMHGKALLVDGTDLLISSANFTFHGLHGNVEFGVRLTGAPVEQAGEVFRAMLESGLLEEVRRPRQRG